MLGSLSELLQLSHHNTFPWNLRRVPLHHVVGGAFINRSRSKILVRTGLGMDNAPIYCLQLLSSTCCQGALRRRVDIFLGVSTAFGWTTFLSIGSGFFSIGCLQI